MCVGLVYSYSNCSLGCWDWLDLFAVHSSKMWVIVCHEYKLVFEGMLFFSPTEVVQSGLCFTACEKQSVQNDTVDHCDKTAVWTICTCKSKLNQTTKIYAVLSWCAGFQMCIV